MKKDVQSETAILRQKAEEVAKKRLSMREMLPSVPEMMKLIEELEVYQVELEMQNEELMRAKEQAETATEKYTELYDFAPSGYFTLSKEAKINELNLSGAKMLGKERSRLKNSQFGFFVSNDTRPIFNLFLGKVFNSKAKESCEVTLSTNDHLPMCVYLTGIVTKNGEQCIVTVSEITHFKRNEEQIKKILDTTIDGFYLVDTAGRILDTNDSYCSMIGYSREELLKLKVKDIEAADTEEVIKERIQRILETGYDRFETKHLRKDGRVIDIEASVNFLIDEQPKLFCFMRDITERKQAEERLRVQTDAMEAAIDGLAILNADQNYIYMNKAHAEIYGYDNAGELVGASWRLLYDTIELQRLDREIMPEFSQKGYYQGRAAGKKKDGSTFLQEISLTALENGGLICSVRDITERKQAEEKIKLFSSAIESAYDGIILTDMNGSLIFANASAINIFGYTPEELMKLNVVSFTADPNIAKEIISKVLLSGKWSGEIKSVRRNKEEFPVILSVSVIKDEKGTPISMMGVFRDITERKWAEEALKQANNELENLHNNLDKAIFSVDIVQNKMLQVSLANKAVFGYPPEEFFKNPQLWYEMIVPEDKPIVDAGYPVLFSGKNLQHEYRIIHPNGEIRWIEAKMKPTLDASGKLIRIDGIASNITDRKRTEEELSESEEKFRNLFNNSEVGMLRTRFDGSEILECNENCLKILNYTQDEIKGGPSVNLWADKHERDEMSKILIAEGHVKDFECGMLNKQGEARRCLISLHLYRDKGILEGSIIDITERKHAEEALRESEEKYRNLFALIPQPIWIYDLETLAFLEVNYAAVSHYGYSRKEFLKMTLKDIRSEEDIPALLNDLESTNHNYNKAGRWRHIKKNGELIIVEITSHSVIFNGRDARQVLVLDITDSLLAEEALRKSEQILEVIINTIPVRVFWKDKNLNYLGCNTSFASDAGFMKSEDIIGKDDYAMSSSKYAELYRTDDKIVMESGKSRLLFEEPLSLSTGELSYILTSKVPLKDAKGEIIGILGAYLDITERKRTEEALIFSETRYRRLFESSKDGILILDANTGMITDVNPFLIEMLGYSKEQFTEKAIWEIGFFKDIIANYEKFIELQQKEYVRYEDLPLETAHGRKIIVEFVSNVYAVNDHNVIQCNIRDITKRRRAEIELREKEVQYRNLADAGLALIWTAGVDRLCNYFNEPWLKFTGRKLEQEIGNG